MGIVYVVYDHEWREAFAAKTYMDEVFALNPVLADRFRREALIWVNLDLHQNVTQARFVETIGGKPFLFLEYVSGGDLSRWIGTPRLTEDLPQVLRFAIQFCDGMNHALSKGIKAHRDIKPQNCLITEDATLKVTDFGLAKVFDDARMEEGKGVKIDEGERAQGRLQLGLTCTGVAAGTAPYMAPEQFDDAKHVDVRADIYSFGAMLFEMVSGRLPFYGQTWEEYKFLHKNQKPPSLGIGNPALEGLIQKCLAKDREARFADFGELRERLAELYTELTGEAAPQPVTGEKLTAVDWNNKGGSLANLGRRAEALECFKRALEINPHLAGAWNNQGNALADLGRPAEALECYQRALEINPHYAEAWYNQGNVLERLGRPAEALECYRRSLEINAHLAAAWYNQGNALAKLGRPAEAVECYRRSLEISPHDAEAWNNQGNALADLGRRAEALECYQRALEINPHYASAWNNRGSALADLGRPAEALECFKRALEINPHFAEAWFNQGALLFNHFRHYGEALGCFEEAQRLGFPQAARAIALCRQKLGLA